MLEILFRNNHDHVKVKKAMENKEQYIVVRFDEESVNNLNVQGMMNAIQDYLVVYGYKVKEYGKDNSTDDESMLGYLYERVGE